MKQNVNNDVSKDSLINLSFYNISCYCLIGETIMEHCKSLDQALENSYEGDTILVYPGCQVLNSPCVIKDSVVITGIGDEVELTGNSPNVGRCIIKVSKCDVRHASHGSNYA